MNTDSEIRHVKDCIAVVHARREQLKQALERGAVTPRVGFAQLEQTDRELSGLDSRFKQLWDAAHVATNTLHPAARWAQEIEFEPAHLDCVTAIMLKILDAKCKMGEPEKAALAAVYDVVKTRPGQSLDAAVHSLIATARAIFPVSVDAALAERIHAWRLRAEASIPKPVMKGFKALLRTSLPMH